MDFKHGKPSRKAVVRVCVKCYATWDVRFWSILLGFEKSMGVAVGAGRRAYVLVNNRSVRRSEGKALPLSAVLTKPRKPSPLTVQGVNLERDVGVCWQPIHRSQCNKSCP